MASDKDRFRLTKLSIKGFKSIDYDPGVELSLGDVTLLMGANGAGKSNIVSFFTLLNFMMSGGFQLYVRQYGTSQVFLHYGSSQTEKILGELTLENSLNKDVYSFTLGYAATDKLLITEEKVSWSKDGKKPYVSYPKGGYDESGLLNTRYDCDKIVRRLVSDCRVFQFHDTSATGPLRQKSEVNDSDYLRANGGNIAAFLYRLKNYFPESYQMIIRYVRESVPQFFDFYLSPDDSGYLSLKWVDRYLPDYVMMPNQLSDGSIRFIALATLLLQPAQTIPNLIVIDEPELGLHPVAIDRLAEMIKSAALSTQLVVATQSASLMDHFSAEDIAIVDFDNDRHSTVVSRLDREELGDWLEDYSLSDLWQKNIIEGRP